MVHRFPKLNHNALQILAIIAAAPSPPSSAELCQACQLHPGSIVWYLRRLRRLGLVRYEDFKARTVRAICKIDLLA